MDEWMERLMEGRMDRWKKDGWMDELTRRNYLMATSQEKRGRKVGGCEQSHLVNYKQQQKH